MFWLLAAACIPDFNGKYSGFADAEVSGEPGSDAEAGVELDTGTSDTGASDTGTPDTGTPDSGMCTSSIQCNDMNVCTLDTCAPPNCQWTNTDVPSGVGWQCEGGVKKETICTDAIDNDEDNARDCMDTDCCPMALCMAAGMGC